MSAFINEMTSFVKQQINDNLIFYIYSKYTYIKSRILTRSILGKINMVDSRLNLQNHLDISQHVQVLSDEFSFHQEMKVCLVLHFFFFLANGFALLRMKI